MVASGFKGKETETPLQYSWCTKSFVYVPCIYNLEDLEQRHDDCRFLKISFGIISIWIIIPEEFAKTQEQCQKFESLMITIIAIP